MGLSYAIHEHVSSSHSYSWEPHTSISSMGTLSRVIVLRTRTHWQLSLLGLFPRSLCGLYWACLVRYTLVWALSTCTPCPCSNYERDYMFLLHLRKELFHNLATLLQTTTMGSDSKDLEQGERAPTLYCWGYII